MSEAKLDVTLYELDASPTSSPDQGGTLDQHTATGLAALRKCGLWDAFSKHVRYDGDEFIIADKNANEFVHAGGGGKAGSLDRPEIDRQRLKEILLESVPDACVRWGRRLREVTEDGMLKFNGREGEGLEGSFDLVVGADGAWSQVRARLTGLQPAYAGVSGHELEITKPARTCPHVNKVVGRGSYCGSSDRKLLNAQRMWNNSIKARSWYVCPEGRANETLDMYGNEGTLEKILERYAGWAPEMTEFLRQGDVEGLRHWTLYELPVGFKVGAQDGFHANRRRRKSHDAIRWRGRQQSHEGYARIGRQS